ncbi:MAG TPA: hypothetical protein VHF69_11315, partial [Candidatus Synoicihabitans sp.]|nr:hypothetical protein [Candidatus Synoicihabitans sp.]
MRFIWFLNFWGWCRETYRAEMLLRHPLEGIAVNWDEWFSGEATDTERAEIEHVGRDPNLQDEFLRWLEDVWIKDAVSNGNQLALHFVRDELSRVSPFDRWEKLAERPLSDDGGDISAVVLDAQSEGEAEDVMKVRAMLLPLGRGDRRRLIVADGFDADDSDLKAARDSAVRLLRGRPNWRMLGRWIAAGRRPYPAWLRLVLAAGWISLGAGIAWLWVGPDPGDALRPIVITLVTVWTVLALVGLATAFAVVRRARSAARAAASLLADDQIRLGIGRRLLVKGGSAGLPYTLGILHAVARAYPRTLNVSWFWRQFSFGMASPSSRWAATGIVNSAGHVQPVELTPKIHSCFKHRELSDLLVPNQPEASHGSLRRAAEDAGDKANSGAPLSDRGKDARERWPKLRIHRCRHVGEAVLAIARLPSAAQLAIGGFALVVSGVMMFGASDLRNIMFPPPAPPVVPPSSPSPYFLWVSLDTPHPAFFQVVLQSPVWANRRADVALQESLPSSVRAEIPLVRLADA